MLPCDSKLNRLGKALSGGELSALSFDEAWVGILAYTFQIYFDFSGYSDMAIGLARMMGFRFPENFDSPYSSSSITEFWRRWHITLGAFMRDFLYIPLGGNRVSNKWRLYFNLWLVFLVSGLWHGANWTFIIWGTIHGFYLIVALLTKEFREKISKKLGFNKWPRVLNLANIFITFILVSFAWIFFRATTIHDALYIAKNAIMGLPHDLLSVLKNDNLQRLNLLYLGNDMISFTLLIVPILILQIIQFLQHKLKRGNILASQPVFIRMTGYSVLILSIILFGKFGSLVDNAIYYSSPLYETINKVLGFSTSITVFSVISKISNTPPVSAEFSLT